MKKDRALLIVDVQNDFCPGGAIAVSGGDSVVPALNQYAALFSEENLLIVASRDWHPKETTHFKEFGGPWPAHCVQNTQGADFHPGLNLPATAVIVSKGTDPDKDSYSAFQASDGQGRELLDILNEKGVKELLAGGLATDYCVKASVLDGLAAGFKVYLLVDAVKGVDIKEGDSVKAIRAMVEKGAQTMTFKDLE